MSELTSLLNLPLREYEERKKRIENREKKETMEQTSFLCFPLFRNEGITKTCL